MSNTSKLNDKTSFSHLLESNKSITADRIVKVTQQTWDKLDSWVTEEQSFTADYITPKRKIEDVYRKVNGVLAQLAAALAELFKINITGSEIKKIETFGELSSLIAKKRLGLLP